MRKWVDEKSKEEGRPWSTLPTFTEDEIKLIKGACLTVNIIIDNLCSSYVVKSLKQIFIFFLGTADFYALNHYSSRLVTHGRDPDPHYNPDAEYVTSVDESWLKPSVAPWLVVINKSKLCCVYCL